MAAVTVWRLAKAIMRGYWNEFSIDEIQGANDPVKLRFGAWRSAGTSYLGALGMDLLSGNPDDPLRQEKGFIAFKLADPDPCIEIWLQRTQDTTEDRDMVLVAKFSVSGGIEGRVGGGGASAAGTTDSIWSADGMFVTQQQTDGNCVTYQLARPFDKGRYKAFATLKDGYLEGTVWEGV